jgi:1-acyl-sn-glycerol-3-phosphate acyltransferase
MARDFGLPVVPAASNLGLYWPQENWTKRPGRAVLEFLDPIPPTLGKDEFMARLEAAVETRTAELIAEATGRPVTPSVLGVPEAERRRAERETGHGS